MRTRKGRSIRKKVYILKQWAAYIYGEDLQHVFLRHLRSGSTERRHNRPCEDWITRMKPYLDGYSPFKGMLYLYRLRNNIDRTIAGRDLRVVSYHQKNSRFKHKRGSLSSFTHLLRILSCYTRQPFIPSGRPDFHKHFSWSTGFRRVLALSSVSINGMSFHIPMLDEAGFVAASGSTQRHNC